MGEVREQASAIEWCFGLEYGCEDMLFSLGFRPPTGDGRVAASALIHIGRVSFAVIRAASICALMTKYWSVFSS